MILGMGIHSVKHTSFKKVSCCQSHGAEVSTNDISVFLGMRRSKKRLIKSPESV